MRSQNWPAMASIPRHGGDQTPTDPYEEHGHSAEPRAPVSMHTPHSGDGWPASPSGETPPIWREGYMDIAEEYQPAQARPEPSPDPPATEESLGPVIGYSEIMQDPDGSFTNFQGFNLKRMVVKNAKMHSETELHVPESFDIVQILGQGGNGFTCAAALPSGERVCVKKLPDALRHLTTSQRYVREMRIMRQLHHDNVVEFHGVYCTGTSSNAPGDIYAIIELVDGDLDFVLRSRVMLTQEHVQFMSFQLIRGLNYLHSVGVMHRDITPRNLLVSKMSEIKICDFGLSRLTSEEPKGMQGDGGGGGSMMSMYVCTRWYRAPELLCFLPHYSTEVDIWSAACVVLEMQRRRPIFAGENTRHQIEIIMSLLGFPEDYVTKVWHPRVQEFFFEMRRRCPPPGRLEQKLAEWLQDENSRDFILPMLRYSQKSRPTAAELLGHPWLAEFYSEGADVIRPLSDPDSIERLDRDGITLETIKREMMMELKAVPGDGEYGS